MKDNPESPKKLAAELELPTAPSMAARLVQSIQGLWMRVHLGKVALFVASLFLFVLAIYLMKDGARAIAPLIRSQFYVTNAANSLGFGWLFAYVIMSGSPVAAASLTFFDAGVVDELGAFAMITGSRLGASFIVLFLGFLYILRGRDRVSSLSMGLLSLTVTGTTHLLSLPLGALLLATDALDAVQFKSGALLNSVFDAVIDPISAALANLLPEWAVFVVGLGIILISFNLFDRCLPDMTLKESQVGHVSRLVYRPGVMLLLGALVTMISMSVSLSLSILVPLSHRGFIRRENVIPYIMGANITTFIDTLLAAVLLSNPPAFTIVLVEMLSVALVSAVILTLSFHQYQGAMLSLVSWVTRSNRNLILFMGVILVAPVVLMLV